MFSTTLPIFALLALVSFAAPLNDSSVALQPQYATSEITVSQLDVLNAFKALGQATPSDSIWDPDTNSTDYVYDFDTAVWDAMFYQLVEEAGESHLVARTDIPKEVLCVGKEGHPFAYAYTLSGVVAGLCGGIHYGAHYVGRTQVYEKTGLRDIHGNKIRVVLKYAYYSTHWASGLACHTAVTYGISKVCDQHVHGNKGAGTATRGSTTKYSDGTRPTLDLTIEVDSV